MTANAKPPSAEQLALLLDDARRKRMAIADTDVVEALIADHKRLRELAGEYIKAREAFLAATNDAAEWEASQRVDAAHDALKGALDV